jgi:TolA-binding protein
MLFVKRTLAITLTCVALAGARADATSESATHAAHAHHAAVKATKAMIHYAPADEYFGPGKMSLLGIRNQLHDLTLQYDVNHDAAQSVFGKTKYAEACLRDWSKKYPADPAIPRHIYLLGHLYGRLAFLPGGPQRESNAQS